MNIAEERLNGVVIPGLGKSFDASSAKEFKAEIDFTKPLRVTDEDIDNGLLWTTG